MVTWQTRAKHERVSCTCHFIFMQETRRTYLNSAGASLFSSLRVLRTNATPLNPHFHDLSCCPLRLLQMETTDAPQILEHINQSVTFTPYETRWIPCSARCVVMGLYPRGTGVLQVWELDKGEFKVIKEVRVRLTCVADRAHAPFVCPISGSFPDHWGCVERDLALPSLLNGGS